jgi:hypothetical protein
MNVTVIACLLLHTLLPRPDSLPTVEVYLIGGQSNATGQGYLANLPQTARVDTAVRLFHSGAPHLNSGLPALTWQPLHAASESPDRFGPELSFGTHVHELRPNQTIVLIKHAHSGTNLYRDWAPGSSAADSTHWGPQFRQFVQTVEAGMRQLRQQGYNPHLAGMIWQQGESDADAGGKASAQYGPHLAQLIQRVREQFQAPDLRFVYGYVYPPPASGKAVKQVRRAQHRVDQRSGSRRAVVNAFVVPTDDLSQRADDPNSPYPNDHIHFGTAGTWQLGLRMADTMIHP